MMFDWQPEYSVGFAEIDALHQRVFQTAGELHAAIVRDQPGEALAQMLAQVIAVIQAHFAAEESLMQASQYPESSRHKAKHDAFSEKLFALEQADSPNVEMMGALKDALIQHIGEEDRELGRHLTSRARA